MLDTSVPTGAPEEKLNTHPPICRHRWVTAAPYQARCTVCEFVVPITTAEVHDAQAEQSR